MASTVCWHCRLLSQMIPNATNASELLGPSTHSYGIFPDPEFSNNQDDDNSLLMVYTCANCGYPNIAELRPTVSLFDGLDLDDVVRWLPIEPIGKLYPNVPADIASVASEVHKCLQIGAYRAAVTLSRTALEGIVSKQENKGTSGKKLYERIQALADSGKLKSRTADAATAIRLCGNVSVHEPTKEIDRDFAEIVVEVLDSVIDDLYTNPELVARAKAYVKSQKKNEVGQ